MGNISILNVDRNPRTRAARADVLAHARFRVVDAADGQAALAALHRPLDGPVLVLLSGGLPDLPELCRAIRETAFVPVFVLRLLGSAGGDRDVLPGADASIRDDYRQPEWLSTIGAFAGLIARQAADRRCIEGLQSELAEKEAAIERLRQEREERLHAAGEAVPVGTWWVDLETGLESRDAGVNRILGLPAEPSMAPVVTSATRISPEDRPRIEAAFRRLNSGEGVYDEEFRILRSDGSIRWVRDRGRIVSDGSGRPVYATGALVDITERKKCEDTIRQLNTQLRRETEILHTIFENIPVMIDFVDAEGRFQFVNRCWTETLGWSLEEIHGRDMFAEFYPDPEYRSHVLDFIRNPPAGFADFEIRTRDGRTLQTSWADVKLSDGTSIGIGIDVTERRRAEEALKFDRALLDALQTAAPVGIGFVDRDFRYLRVNRAFTEITGFPAEQHVGRTLREMVPDLWPQIEGIYRRVLEGGEVAANIEIAGETGAQPGVRRYWLANYYPLKVAGETVAAGAVIQEITGQKRTEEALRESERRLELALAGADLGSWDWNLQTGEMIIDDRWAKVFGGVQEPIVTDYEGWLRGVHPDDKARVLDVLNSHLEGRLSFYEAEYRFLPPEGNWTWVMVRGRIVERDEAGKPLRIVGMYRDISVRKALEERLEQQREQILHVQRLATAGELVGMVAHELNQPLGAIANYLGGAMLRFEELLAANPPMEEAISEALRLSKRAAQVVKSIRDLVRGRDDQWDWVPIQGLIHDSLLLVQAEFRKHQIRVELDVAPDLPPVWGQPVHLQQLLLNLALNAMEAMESTPPEFREFRIHAERTADGEIELLVTDRGRGLSPDLASRLFEPFVTDKPEGIGLGLSICRTIVENHGGRIEADPPREVGATFRIRLPAGGAGEP
jgi:PAS domain S-box-containing protein